MKNLNDFIIIGENLHCSRTIRADGAAVKMDKNGRRYIAYAGKGESILLPVPPEIAEKTDWTKGRLHHCVIAVRQGLYGQSDAQAAAAAYVRALARQQAEAGAAFLDLNVDEFSPDLGERRHAMQWLAETVQEAVALPISVDSSHVPVLEAGLQSCREDRPRLLNSAALERPATVALAARYQAGVVASAAGENGIPSAAEERVANLDRLFKMLTEAGVAPARIFFDPLVLPVSTDSGNPGVALATIRLLREKFGQAVHITGGFSNVSFGMPARRLINLVFTHMAIAAGADSGIVDPLQVNAETLAQLDIESAACLYAQKLLDGSDMFGVEFIAAHREGRLVV